MRRLWSIVQYEFARYARKLSFVLSLFSVPAVIGIAIAVAFVSVALRPNRLERVGCVDPGGEVGAALVAESRPELGVQWEVYDTESAAQRALRRTEISAYYVLPGSQETEPMVRLVYTQEPGGAPMMQIRTQVRRSLLAGQPVEVAQRVIEGSRLTVRSPGAAPGSAREFVGGPTLGQLLPALSGFSLMLLVFISSGYLMGAVGDEKAGRMIEILLTSTSARQLVLGKVLAVGGLAVAHLLVWGGCAAALVALGGGLLGLDWLQDLRVDPGALLVAVAVLVPCYVTVAALMTALGVYAAESQTGQQMTLVLITTYLIPLSLVVAWMHNLNSPMMVGLSLFPLSAPVVLSLRAAFVTLPPWQIATSVALQALCALASLGLAGRALRSGSLRYGRWTWGRGRERGGIMGAGPTRRRTLLGAGWRLGGKVLSIVRHEIWTTLTRPVFIGTCIGVPLLLFAQLGLVRAGFGAESRSGGAAPQGRETAAADIERFGLVDRSGLLQGAPALDLADTLAVYRQEPEARAALAAGEIPVYCVVSADYVSSGELVCIRPDHSPLAATPYVLEMERVLAAALLGGDAALAARVRSPVQIYLEPWSGEEAVVETAADRLAGYLAPMLTSLVVYGVIVMASGLVLSGVSKEKENRVIEVLLLSVSPGQMLAGKVLAQGAVGLVQAGVWVGIGALTFWLSGESLDLLSGFSPSPAVIAWSVLFMLLGYALYACLGAGVGCLVPDLKASRGAPVLLYAPAFVGFEINLLTHSSPNGVLSTAASLVPLTSPFVIFRRLLAGGMPLWQTALSALLLVLAIVLVARATAHMFRAQNLLSGQRFSARRYLRALMG